MEVLGRHILVEFSNADPEILNDVGSIRSMMYEAAKVIQSTVLHEHFHRFQPIGVTGILAIAESHLSIHTWPEYQYAAVDIFTCGDTRLLDKAVELLKKELKAEKVHQMALNRGPGPIGIVIEPGEKISPLDRAKGSH